MTMGKVRELNIPRRYPAKREPAARVRDFDEIDDGFTARDAIIEAARCVQCAQPPCAIFGCPLSNRIPEWLDHLVNARFRKAAETIARTSNMPEACGKLCPHEALCESRCVVGQVAEPVSIGRLEEFVTKLAREQGWYRTTPARSPTSKRIAIVGSGPAGLSAAEELLDRGHAVTVFEKLPLPGGLLVFGVPQFKYAMSRMQGLVDRIKHKGAEFRCGVHVGRGLSVDDLLDAEGFDAVLLAVGAEKARRAAVPGEHLPGIHLAIDFLNWANVPRDIIPADRLPPVQVGRFCAVIGGGDTAMDCARTALRLGYEEVHCVYRRTEEQMPGRLEDRKHAVEEGTRFDYLVSPVAFLGDDRVTAMCCVRNQLGEPDAGGRPRPVPIPGSEFEMPVDTVVLALGFEVYDQPARAAGITMARRRIAVDADLATDRPGVFAAGDAQRGAHLIVTAVNDGRRAAAAIDRYLHETKQGK